MEAATVYLGLCIVLKLRDCIKHFKLILKLKVQQI